MGSGARDRENSEEALISVIVPVYNGQDYLADCIKSIENQTYQKLEIIIVNDGSGDGTAKVCDCLQSAYHNIQVITMDDQGVSAARNAGLLEAKGEFVTFVDADDRLHSSMLRMLYDSMERTKSDIVGCRFFIWSDEAQWRQKADGAAEETETVIYDAAAYLREALLKGNSRCWSKLYRRNAIGDVQFQEGLSIGEDMLFVLKLLSRVERIAEIDFQGYGYYQNPRGAIQRAFTPQYMDQITCWKLAREEVLRMDESLDAQVSALYLMGVMLTVGKLAGLPRAQRKRYEDYVVTCREELKKIGRVPGVYGRLSAGYRLKAWVFRLFPHGYLHMYHFWRSR